MSRRHRSSILLSFLSPLVLLALLVTACGSASSGSNGSSPPVASEKSVSIGLGYIPDVQFAPFYVAQSKGYYSSAGLNVTFNHGIVPDLFGSMVSGKNTFVFAGGDDLSEVSREPDCACQLVDQDAGRSEGAHYRRAWDVWFDLYRSAGSALQSKADALRCACRVDQFHAGRGTREP